MYYKLVSADRITFLSLHLLPPLPRTNSPLSHRSLSYDLVCSWFSRVQSALERLLCELVSLLGTRDMGVNKSLTRCLDVTGILQAQWADTLSGSVHYTFINVT